MHIFHGDDLSHYLTQRYLGLEHEVMAEDKNKLLNMDETSYIDYLVKKHQVESFTLHYDKIAAVEKEEYIPSPRLNGDLPVFHKSGEGLRKQVLTYHLPFSGNGSLFELKPLPRLMWTMEVEVTPDVIIFDIINWGNNLEKIKNEAEQIITKIQQQADYSLAQVRSFNNNLKHKANEIVKHRKNELLKKSHQLENIGIPIKSRQDIDTSLLLPTPHKPVRVEKPLVSDATFTPEPCLDNESFHSILNICETWGLAISKYPSVYKERSEEILRDFFLMAITPHFETHNGDAFVSSGKSNILLRHDNNNVFIAKCKFWTDEKAHQETISETLRSFTWRSSKAVILYFVKKHKLETINKKIIEQTPKHKAFVSDYGNINENWFNYHFHMVNDQSRGVELAIMTFHLDS